MKQQNNITDEIYMKTLEVILRKWRKSFFDFETNSFKTLLVI